MALTKATNLMIEGAAINVVDKSEATSPLSLECSNLSARST